MPKNRTIFVKKASIKMMTSSEQGNVYYFKFNFLCFKAILVLNLSTKFEYDWIKDEEAAPIKI